LISVVTTPVVVFTLKIIPLLHPTCTSPEAGL
jgi:hypothetical protein